MMKAEEEEEEEEEEAMGEALAGMLLAVRTSERSIIRFIVVVVMTRNSRESGKRRERQ